LQTTITQNRIFANGGEQLRGQNVEPITGLDLFRWQPETQRVTGRTCARCTVEFFANPTLTPAGALYLARVQAAADGTFQLMLPTAPPLPYLSATVTTIDGTTPRFFLPSSTLHLYLPWVVRQREQ
jgi:hypothetical protein